MAFANSYDLGKPHSWLSKTQKPQYLLPDAATPELLWDEKLMAAILLELSACLGAHLRVQCQPSERIVDYLIMMKKMMMIIVQIKKQRDKGNSKISSF